jgi:hypothetical protein
MDGGPNYQLPNAFPITVYGCASAPTPYDQQQGAQRDLGKTVHPIPDEHITIRSLTYPGRQAKQTHWMKKQPQRVYLSLFLFPIRAEIGAPELSPQHHTLLRFCLRWIRQSTSDCPSRHVRGWAGRWSHPEFALRNSCYPSTLHGRGREAGNISQN